MSRVRMIWKREFLRALFQPSYAFSAAVFTAMTGLNFWKQVHDQSGQDVTLNLLLFGSLFFWVLVLLWVSVVTLRTFPEEVRSGTLELWLAAPVREWELVLGKFAAVWLLIVLGTLPLAVYAPLLRWAEAQPWPIPWVEIWTALAGLWGIAGLLAAVGMAVALVFETPLPAFLAVFSAGLLLFFAESFVPFRWTVTPRWGYSVMLIQQAGDWSRGVADTRSLVALATGMAFFLFLSVRLLQLKRLR